ncbi:DUF3999 family protein [uncultured Sphingomonas sp.]|uniref:DUF3999 family protein n=1 Tax=uncultured Sphingomonas sp. TaxID=158754 RepID=UPI0025FE7803|nr:DUF3999 family protein [uncultured Sphingomonas sp.]
MSVRATIAFLLAVLAAGCRPDPAVDVSKPEAFARHAVLQPAAGGKLQRVILPPLLLAAARRRDLGDIRLFDARGRLVAMALLGPGTGSAPRTTVDLPVYPVLGRGEELQNSKLSIRVEDGEPAQAVTVDRFSRDKVPMPAVLLDARALRDRVEAIVLRANIPAGRPVPLTLLTSANLKDWEPLAQKVLFRPAAGGPMLAGEQVTLNGADLRGRFVGISWTGSSGVALTGAIAVMAGSTEAGRVAVATAPLSLTDAHQLQLQLPDNGRLTALRVTAAPADGIVPVRLYGRSPGRDAWSALGAATLSAERGPSTIELPAVPMASYRIEADRRTAGFSAALRVELLFDSVELLLALSGTPPYRMAVGQPAAQPNYLTLAEVAGAGASLDLATLPRATITSANEPPPAIPVQGQAADGMRDRRKLVMWAALVLGTLVLAWAAFRLARASHAGAPA